MSDNQIEDPRSERPDIRPAAGTTGGCRSCQHSESRGKLNCHNWLEDIPGSMAEADLVEVQFKNTRKGFYRNSNKLVLSGGDMVAVEASPGHDVGRVTLTGPLVRLQMKRAGVKSDADLKRVFRIARQGDLDKYEEAKAREHDTMIRARKIAESLKLNMKIGDVEYQGDGNKAIFYYIADERVDFRQLIKVLAETFKVRIEMKQIGARQEAGRIGGIGPCGRPLCCASWMTNFVSVGTAAARFQDISLNPQKLAGQCAKLKCCLNFEVDAYVESVKKLPPKEIRLETIDNTYFHFKHDVFKQEVTYSTDKSMAANLVTIDAERAFEIIAMNKRGEKPDSLLRDEDKVNSGKSAYNDILGQDITRFDKKKRKKKPQKKEKTDKAPQSEQPKPTQQPQQPQQQQSQSQQPTDAPRKNKKPQKPRPADENPAPAKENPQNAGNRNRDRRDRRDRRPKPDGGGDGTQRQHTPRTEEPKE